MEELLSREECRSIQMKILDEIRNLCESYDLHYYLAYGSLLGAVRHKGFIPWDDDIDICMPRREYDQLISILKDDSKNKCTWLGVIDGTMPNYYYTFAKAVDNRTVAKMEDNITAHGIWVDIFPLDGLPEKESECWFFLRYCFFLRALVLSMTTDFSRIENGKKAIVKRIFNVAAKVIGKSRVYNHYENVCRRYSYDDSQYVGVLFSAYGIRERIEKEKISDEALYQFEDRVYTGFSDYDYYLSQMYGDYMKIPPVEKRKTHSITAYWK